MLVGERDTHTDTHRHRERQRDKETETKRQRQSECLCYRRCQHNEESICHVSPTWFNYTRRLNGAHSLMSRDLSCSQSRQITTI